MFLIFNEIQLNEVALNKVIFVKFDKIISPMKKSYSFNKSNYFHMLFFFIKYL